MNRRDFLIAAGAGAARDYRASDSSRARSRPADPQAAPAQGGDTVGVVTPATATFQQVELDIVRESLEALGLKVRIGEHVMNRYGSLGGADKDRAATSTGSSAIATLRRSFPRAADGAARDCCRISISTSSAGIRK
jgi:muramoyltetrapeptide carboxypeptidase